MYQFRLLGIPVDVQVSHLIGSLVLGLLFVDGDENSRRWPGPALQNPDTRMSTLLFCVAAWVVIIFISVLVHEMGHALSSKHFGYQPTVTLVALGGLTLPNAQGPIPWKRDVALTFAGPLAGLGLGLFCFVNASYWQNNDVARYLFSGAAMANIFWSGVNLLPVMPLDGGRISQAIFMRVFGTRGFLFSQVLGLGLSGAVVVWSINHRATFLALFFGLYGFRAFQAISAYNKGELPQEPLAPALTKASELLAAAEFDKAEALLSSFMAKGPPDNAVAHAHYLLGWIALKRADGPKALYHFQQTHGIDIEPQAMAAALSLAGDDASSLPYWKTANSEKSTPTLLHEWAGALLRLGRTDEAWALPSVQPAVAYQCAERVLFLRGEFSAAAKMGEAAVEHAPSATLAYDTACAYAKSSDFDAALRLLNKAQALGFVDVAHAETDSDLDALRHLPAFNEWLSGLKEKRFR